jgi:hypothetical protein
MKTIIKEKYLYDSNKMLASQPASQPASQYKPKQKIRYKASAYEANLLHTRTLYVFIPRFYKS